MNVKVKAELYRDKIKALELAIEPSVRQAAEAVKSQAVADQVVPKETGELERTAYVRKKSRTKYQVVYKQPYARRLYWHPEYSFRRDKNPNARGTWLQAHIDGERKGFFKKAFMARLKANAGGLVK